jgi:flavorubredoxin
LKNQEGFMKAVLLRPDIYWVGAIDWAVRDFHGYVTPRGTTYNNYLIMDEVPTLIDAVKEDFADLSISNISGLIEPAGIKNIVVNHIEPDHASGLEKIMRLSPGAGVYCTEKGRRGLEKMFDITEWNVTVVKTGDELKIGKRTLLFIETPMLHWPDSMMTYLREDKILFSQDAFGQHLASSQRYDDEFVEAVSSPELKDAVWDYYANILMPFGTLIRRKIDEVTKLGIEIEIIAPDHGIIWRKDPGWILQEYLDMAGGKADERVVVIYDTMWHSTERMVHPIMEGIKKEGMDVRVIKLRSTPVSVAVKEFWKARGCLVGSPTLNNTMFPRVGEFLLYLKGLKPKNRIASAFGSYGWGGGAVRDMIEALKAMKLQTVEPGLGVVSRPSPEDEGKCYDFGKSFAKKVREYHLGIG